MIVICTGCQARFRVADEKVGPRGAKVRCSRCQNVFVVRREPPAAPPPHAGIELDLTPGLPRRPAEPAPAGGSVLPFPGAAPRPRDPAPDPFAAVGLDGFGAPGALADDPFARAAAAAAPAPAPGIAVPAAPAAASADPFAQAADPFSIPASSGGTAAQRLPVTDLAQLLGAPASSPPAPPAAPSTPAPDFAAPPDLFAAPDFGASPDLSAPPDFGASPDLSAAPDFGAPPELSAASGLAAAADAPADLALEDRGTPGPAPFADPGDVFLADPSEPAIGAAAAGAAFEAGLGGPPPGGEESLALATEATPGVAEPAAPPPPRAEPAPPRRRTGPPPRATEEADAPAAPATAPRNRLRAATVNALALVALLAVALAFRVVLRGDASLGPSALRPSTLLRALGGRASRGGAFDVSGVRTGVYPQTSGGSVLFVRGEIVSRAAGPVEAVRVEAELLRGDEVLARGEARAGAIPLPEEVDRATDRAALDELAAATARRAPRAVAPGDRLEFLVTLGDAPSDVSGASVRVRAEAAGAGAPR